MPTSPHPAPIDLLGRCPAARARAPGLSVSELAKRARIAKSTLSQLEAGSGNPSLETLWALATALGVQVTRLIAEPRSQVHVIRPAKAWCWPPSRLTTRATLLAVCPAGLQRDLYRLSVQPGAPRTSQSHLPGTVEHVVLCSGRARLGPVGQLVELAPGRLRLLCGGRGACVRGARGGHHGRHADRAPVERLPARAPGEMAGRRQAKKMAPPRMQVPFAGSDACAPVGAARSDALAYSPVRVSISILSPWETNSGTATSKPVAILAGLSTLARRVALDGRSVQVISRSNAGGQFDRDGLAVVEHHFDSHAVFQVVQRVAMFSASTSYWLSLSNADVHGVGEVRVRAFLLVEDDVVDLGRRPCRRFSVPKLPIRLLSFMRTVARAAPPRRIRSSGHHRVLAVHDHVAGEDFLSDFHSRLLGLEPLYVLERSGARRVAGPAPAHVPRRGRPAGTPRFSQEVRPWVGAKPGILAFSVVNPSNCVRRSSCASSRERAARAQARQADSVGASIAGTARAA